MTTISAGCANRLQTLHAESGTRYVSGPVLGRPDAAASGELVEFLAGDASAVAEVAPIVAPSRLGSFRFPVPPA